MHLCETGFHVMLTQNQNIGKDLMLWLICGSALATSYLILNQYMAKDGETLFSSKLNDFACLLLM
ncbi:rCG40525 [Rattus norvegicus]|uniref:RCG40525 n=1 Tax=Rattus norvegicus TaxID=10116 RepID=A6I842_RAT|nr:rCG40525 [Rattus norvegicus]